MNSAEQINHLANSIHHQKGVYAVLLGAGMSKAAGLPSAWEILHHLSVKLATLHDLPVPTLQEDLNAWHHRHFKRSLSYSDLIERMEDSPFGQQRLLERFFEPTAEDRENHQKLPTEGHRALARLCRDKFIRVILTTNFDRLMEQALAEENLYPIVLSSPTDVNVTDSLMHGDLFLIKLHGDYRMANVRNSYRDLTQYPAEWIELLKLVFGHFGLITCGWSGESDLALREAMTQSSARRYSLYWSSYSIPGDESAAMNVIRHRKGRLIAPIDGDQLFAQLEAKVNALEHLNYTPPSNLEALGAEMKRHLSNMPSSRVPLEELLERETLRFIQAFSARRDGVSLASRCDIKACTHALQYAENVASRLGTLGVLLAKHHTEWGLEVFQQNVLRHLPEVWNSKHLMEHDIKAYALAAVLSQWMTGFVAHSRWEYLRHLHQLKYKPHLHRKKENLVYQIRCQVQSLDQTVQVVTGNIPTPLNSRLLQATETSLARWIPTQLRTSFLLGELITNFICWDTDQYSHPACYLFDDYANRYEEQELMKDWLVDHREEFRTMLGDRLRNVAQEVQDFSQRWYPATGNRGFLDDIVSSVVREEEVS